MKIVRASVAASTDPEQREAMRELFQDVDDEGFGTTRARLPIDQHAIVEQAIARAVDSDAAASLPQKRADALVRICESYLASGDASRNPPARNNAVVHGEVGLPIGCGRQTRTISRKLRRAIKKRSGGGCEWVGCTERRYVEAHHVWHWERGGPTELWNLVNLCWHHHHRVHEGGYRLRHDGRGRLWCHRPDGTHLTDPIPTTAPPLDITLPDDIIVPLWAGETFDLGTCVDAVLDAGAARFR